jgi:capsular exopolysaccharide synthesis family protein
MPPINSLGSEGPVAERGSPRVSLVDPGSPSAEPFRTLRLALQLRAEGGAGALVVTSSKPGDGKSTIVANLASVTALGGSSVLLIDADLRKPVQHDIFQLARSPGLVDLLAGGGSLNQFVQRVGDQRFDVLTAGRALSSTGEVASSTRMKGLLAEASADYDVVVIDAPPVAAGADAEELASNDGTSTLFVVCRDDRRRDIVGSLRRLELAKARIAGLVMNKEGTLGAYGY